MKKSIFLMWISTPAFAGGVATGGGGMWMTNEQIKADEAGEFLNLDQNDFAEVVAGSLTGKILTVNEQAMKADKLDFATRTILMRNVKDPKQTLLIKENAEFPLPQQ